MAETCYRLVVRGWLGPALGEAFRGLQVERVSAHHVLRLPARGTGSLLWWLDRLAARGVTVEQVRTHGTCCPLSGRAGGQEAAPP